MSSILLTLLIVSPPIPPQGLETTVFEPLTVGTAPALGNVRVLDTNDQNPDVFPPQLQGIELLPIDFVGRTNFRLLDESLPRLFSDIPGAGRLRLPATQGCLYHYRRPGTGGEADRFGFFHVTPAGRPSPLFELPATAAGNPFHERVAIPSSGDAFLVGTTPDAGGDLYEVELLTGLVTNRTQDLSPLEVRPYGLALTPTFGAALTPDGPVRFARQPDAQAEAVPFPRKKLARAKIPGGLTEPAAASTPIWFGDDIVCCADGSTMAVIGGDSPDEAFVWCFEATGRASQATATPEPLSGAGFQPGSNIGPTLALSPNGSNVAYRVRTITNEGETSQETFLREIDPMAAAPSAIPTIQITADANFADTLNDSGVIAFVEEDVVVMIVGESDNTDEGEIDSADFYRVERQSGGGIALTNVSASSGDLAAPFLESGDLDTGEGMYHLPGSNSILAYIDPGSQLGRIERIDLALGTSEVLVTRIRELFAVDSVNGDVMLSLRNDATSKTDFYVIDGVSLDMAFVGGVNATYSRWASHPDGYFACIFDMPQGQLLGRINLSTGFGDLATGDPHAFGPTVGFRSDGAIQTTLQLANRSYDFAWRLNNTFELLAPSPAATFVLPGM